jgi:hypothetical protein
MITVHGEKQNEQVQNEFHAKEGMSTPFLALEPIDRLNELRNKGLTTLKGVDEVV